VNAKDQLTKQERVILEFVAQGWRTSKIARELFISPRTVETHLAHIFEKLGVRSRTEAAIVALQANIVVMSMEIGTNPDDIFDNNAYAYGHELSDTPTFIRKELA
jgi:DNA-binding CsgD family transcriptional regulator